MERRLSIATGIVTVLAAVFALLLAVTVPAQAHHKTGHDKGTALAQDEAGSSSASSTDDDDDNAHPSGKDRETNDGAADDEQGKSDSEPDDDGHGPERDYNGTDKTGGPGGVDTEDQDGNNGCGNDDDFEDDNEGWCGQKPKPSKDDEVAGTTEDKCVDDDTMAAGEECDEEIAGGTLDDDAAVDDLVQGDLPEADVLGLRVAAAGAKRPAVSPLVRGARTEGAVLPFTGGDPWGFVFLALGLVAAGYLMLRMRRT